MSLVERVSGVRLPVPTAQSYIPGFCKRICLFQIEQPAVSGTLVPRYSKLSVGKNTKIGLERRLKGCGLWFCTGLLWVRNLLFFRYQVVLVGRSLRACTNRNRSKSKQQ